MKKAPLYLLFALFGALTFASCKKDYTCQCTVGVPFLFDTTVNIQISDAKKKQAKVACDNSAEAIQVSSAAMISAALSGLGADSLFGLGGVTVPTNIITASCDLK